jgi:hypothetical protein
VTIREVALNRDMRSPRPLLPGAQVLRVHFLRRTLGVLSVTRPAACSVGSATARGSLASAECRAALA